MDGAVPSFFRQSEQKKYPLDIVFLRNITETARNAAKLAEIDESILAIDNGYNTQCTPEIFSQGEWQLLSIARAAAANPAVLLLDEITANLDAETAIHFYGLDINAIRQYL